MTKENEKKPKEKPNTRKIAFRNEAINALMDLDDVALVTFQKAMEVAKLDCKKCVLHDTSHNPKTHNCRDNPFCISRLGLEKFEKLIALEQETKEEAKKDQKRRDLNEQPAGLVNGGNFCYVNSFLQVWFNVPEFRQLVYDFRPSDAFEPPPAPRMDVQATMMALQDIFYTLQTTPFNDADKTAGLGKLLRLNSEQQDSQEFGLKFFNALERCLPDHPNGQDTLNRLKDLFTGEICTRIVCKCGQRSEREETAISLSLNIEGHSTLLDALDSYFGEEHLDDYKCQRCSKTGSTSKQSDYVKLPPVIVIQLNRYKYTAKGRQKLKTPMAYPREIPARAFQRTDLKNAPPAEFYDLFAVTIHEGSNAECGHYYDLIKSPLNQKWYRYNDETVESIAKPPGTDKPTTGKVEKSRRKDKEKYPTDQKACYGLLYRRRDAILPLPHPILPSEELIKDSKHAIEELFEGLTKKKIEKSEKRLYDLERRINKLKTSNTKLETHIDKYEKPNEIAFLPISLLTDVLAMEYEVAKGEKKKKKKEKSEKEEEKKTTTTEDEDLAAAIAASEADQMKHLNSEEGPSTSASGVGAVEDGQDEERAETETPEATNTDASMEEIIDNSEGTPTKEIDILAIAMEESALPTVDVAQEPEHKKRTRQKNGDVKYVFTNTRSPRKSAGNQNQTPLTSPQKQPVSTRVAALLSSHEMSVCGHGKMSIDPILYGDVKAVSRAPAMTLLREYDFRVKVVYDNGEKVYPQADKERDLFVFTAEDICMECILEMREEGIFSNQLEEDDKMVRRILKEERQRCSVKNPSERPEGHVYVAKFALSNFKKSAITNRENKLAKLHTKKGTLSFDPVSVQKTDANYPSLSGLKRPRGRPFVRKSEVPEKMQKLDEEGMTESVMEEDEENSMNLSLDHQNPTRPVDTIDPEILKPVENIEFNSELRCAHGGINFSQFRHSVSPEEWSRLKGYFDECYEVSCSQPVCAECRQMEVDAQNGTDNMRVLVKEMRKRINDTLKAVEARAEAKSEETDVKFGICSVFIEKLKKLTNRQSTSPPSICQECLICQHQQPFKGFLTEDNQKDAHVIGLTEDEWHTILAEIRNLEEAGDEHAILVDPKPIHIENGNILDMCAQCFEQHIKFTEERKYLFDNENIYVKLVNLSDEEDVTKANGKSRRGRAKNVYAIKMSSSNTLMELKVQLYDKTHQLPNDQMLYRTLGGEQFDKSINQKTLFDLRLSPNNNDNPLILIAQQFSPSSQTDETGDRAPERGFVDTALAH
ncbi:hypothetical protein GCK72_000463 [Caenorhabditis remanei]|uniref:ubiquitinyl hydrolase 1 n=1 Tax=Caenorhabditis remanei TaxID=31234 RepID=A0A6A5HN74_CAERE|nr:hypothetical protein GCK72_000463 [Caenorhabditis remanei]KAF1768651.1 hypothetical protein GCK72_000463 [Caenorhabditis remanei]